MHKLRTADYIFNEATKLIDYSVYQWSGYKNENLPSADVLKYIFSDGSWVVFRPSGTEPKIKVYYCIRDNKDSARHRLAEYKEKV